MIKSIQRSIGKFLDRSDSTNLENEVEENKDEISEETKTEKIISLRDKVSTVSLYQIPKEDIYLNRWLAICNWDVDSAFNRLIKYHKFFHEHPDWNFSTPISKYDALLQRQMAVILKNRDKLGRRIYLMNVKNMNVDEVAIEEMAQLDTLWMEMVNDEPDTLKNGVAIILDMKDVTVKILKWYTPRNSYLSSIFATIGPLNNFDIHIINEPAIVHILNKCIFPFLTKSIKEKIHFYGTDLTKLHDILGPNTLPEKYGGPQPLEVDYEERLRDLHSTLESKKELLSYL